MKKLLVISTLFLLTTTAHAGRTTSVVTEDYLKIQTLLAHDTFEGVPQAAKDLSTNAKAKKQIAISKAADKVASAKDITDARLQFEKVSVVAIPYLKKISKDEIETVYCPMKKARWAQKKGPMENPYYGKEMLECGVKD